MQNPFVGRKRELALLDKLAKSEEAEFLVVYGRRRVGKSRLLLHWVKKHQKPFLYWVATQTTHTDSLRNFSKALYQFLHPDEAPVDDFTYYSWEIALKEVYRAAKQQPFVLILDEFTYALQSSPELASVLQNAWDQYFKETSLFLVISGSQVHMMMKAVHSYHAPLYGRASARLHLRPLRYQGVAEFLPTYAPDELVAVQAVVGGIPAYLEKLDPKKSFSYNLQEKILQPATLMQSDAVLLLHEQFDEPANYAAILKAIAFNKRTSKDIVDFTNIPQTHISRYLATLTALGLIERRIPLPDLNKANSRKGRYHIQDPYLRFYFRFIEPELNRLELDQSKVLLKNMKQYLRGFVGEHSFENLCRDWVGIVSNDDKIPLLVNQIGSYWGSDAQIDVMATANSEKQVLIGECKWGESPIEIEVLEKLIRQAPKAISHLPEPTKWTPYYYLFTRTPLTTAAQAYAKEHQVTVITLEQLDADLRAEV